MHPLEGQCLLHKQHKLGSSPGCVLTLQLQPGSLWIDDARLSEALHPGCLLLRVLPKPGTLDPAGGKNELGMREAHLCSALSYRILEGTENAVPLWTRMESEVSAGKGMGRKLPLGVGEAGRRLVRKEQ